MKTSKNVLQSILFTLFAFGTYISFCQSITLTFEGEDLNHQYLQLDSVVITNLSRGWSETIYYPDTILSLENSIGIEDFECNDFILLQNVPNPFNGQTDFGVQMIENGKVDITVFDLSGRKITELHQTLDAGLHSFRILLSIPQTYMLSVKSMSNVTSVKMVNTGRAYANRIEYLGSKNPMVSCSLNLEKGQSYHPYESGDWMRYVGYATVGGVLQESFMVTNQLDTSQTLLLSFDVVQQYWATVTTDSVTNITRTTAHCGGNVINNGLDTVFARGVCWSTNPNPMVSDSHTTNGVGLGAFHSEIAGLVEQTTYYVRAYATNSQGTSYGAQRIFTTEGNYDSQPCPGTPMVTDVDGNTYNTVQIGDQCWMKENLRTTRYADGTLIPLGTTHSDTTAYRYYPYNDSSNVSVYGYLYNWTAVMYDDALTYPIPSRVQGICPTNWHVPRFAEWEQLDTYVNTQSQYLCDGLYTIAKALASTTGWHSITEDCCIGNNPSLNNATGFSAVPAGYYGGSFGGNNHLGFSRYAYFWAADLADTYGSRAICLNYGSAYIAGTNNYRDIGYSVRCVRD